MHPIIHTAEILCVGTELLLGDIVNTNAAFLSRRLAELGIGVYHQSVVGDHPGRLTEALEMALSRADLVITSGGLGPTYDDLTRETVAAAFGLPLQRDERVLARIRDYFASMGRQMTQNNERQAMVPCGATVLENGQGTAPGLIVTNEQGDKTVILLPGPPSELLPMVDAHVMPYLRARTDGVLVSKNVHIFGMGESAVENALRPLIVESKNPTVAPYCSAGEVRLRVKAQAENEQAASKLCDEVVTQIRKSEVGRHVYAISRDGEYTLEQSVIEALRARGKTVACAESCTGGLIAKRLTDVLGSSAVFKGGFVTYTNEMKIDLLGVSPETIEAHTELSEKVAAEMARGARLRTGADVAVSTTGLAGPGGGTDKCPVGTVYVGISRAGQGEQVVKLSLSPNRSRDYIRTLAASHALRLMLD